MQRKEIRDVLVFCSGYLLFSLLSGCRVPAFAADPFKLGQVNFFKDTPETYLNMVKAPLLWSEPVLNPDGRISLYTPPAPVINFLEAPDDQTARHYLDWVASRMAKVNKAQNYLENYLDRETLNAF